MLCTKHTVIIFVSRSTQLTSAGGSYRSKNRESTPVKNGNGACKISTKPENNKRNKSASRKN